MKFSHPRLLASLCALAAVVLLLAGCAKASIDRALESDANGYVCGGCKARFYTARDIFPIHCPQCKQQDIQQVVGYVCAEDKHVSVSPRGRSGMTCEKCGKSTAGLCIPREADLKSWGAAKKTGPEVGVN